MLNSTDIIKLYFILNKLMYKHSEVGNIVFNKQSNPDIDNPDFKQLLEVSLAIDLLLETNDSILLEGEPYPFYGLMESKKFNQLTDYLTYKYDLDPLPEVDFPKNTTNYVLTGDTINTTTTGTSLPSGGGPGFYLTKDFSGNIVWEDVDEIIADFNSL